MIGQPIVAFATTEIPVVLEDGVSGLLATDLPRLVSGMRALLADRDLAARLGGAAREIARERFSIEWTRAFEDVTSRRANAHPLAVPSLAGSAAGAGATP